MSLIPDRHRCSTCDGYVGHEFRNLASRCKCDDPVNLPVKTLPNGRSQVAA